MNITQLTYEEKVQILKDIFDSTNIVLLEAYGASSKITSRSISIEADRDMYNPYQDDKESEALIVIDTEICTG